MELKDKISKSVFRRLRVVRGPGWWINEDAPPNGIGPVCLYCDRLIDWGPTDHGKACPVRKHLKEMGYEEDGEPDPWKVEE